MSAGAGGSPDAMPVVDRIVAAPVTSETERVRAIYERMAGGYDRMIATWERLLFEDGRQWVCSRARGSVLEMGVGTGRNLDRYPDAPPSPQRGRSSTSTTKSFDST